MLNFSEWLYNERTLEPPPKIKNLLNQAIDKYYTTYKDELQKLPQNRDYKKLEKAYTLTYSGGLENYAKLIPIAKPIKIQFTSQLAPNVKGQYSPSQQTIFINNNISTANDIMIKKSTINHEFIHHLQNLMSTQASQKIGQNVQAGIGPKQATKSMGQPNTQDKYAQYLQNPIELHPWINNTINMFRIGTVKNVLKNDPKLAELFSTNPEVFTYYALKKLNDKEFKKTLFNNGIKNRNNMQFLKIYYDLKDTNPKMFQYVFNNLFKGIVEKDYTEDELKMHINAQSMAQKPKIDPQQQQTNNVINLIKKITPAMAQKYLAGSSVITSNPQLSQISKQLNPLFRDKNIRNNQQIMDTLQTKAKE